MATKSANVTARVQPEIKQRAEAILDQLGLPVSVLIDTLYRQIIMTGGVPYPLTIPKSFIGRQIIDPQFSAVMEKGDWETADDETAGLDEVLAEIHEGI